MADDYDEGKYDLGCPAEEMYGHLVSYRQQVVDTGRRLAKVTIPSVFPPDAYHTGDHIGTNNQSFNAQCVNTLASKLMFMALSPFRPILRFQVIEHKLQDDINQKPELWDTVQQGLAKLEIEHRQRLEATQIRSQYVAAIKVLLIAGNVLWEHMDINVPVHHLPNTYAVKRNTKGEPLISILKQEVYFADLDADVKALVEEDMPEGWAGKPEYEKHITVYRVCRRCRHPDTDEPFWEYWEEYKGKVLPDTEMDADFDTPPLYPAWMIPVPGQNWGRSYCEEYEGDLLRIEKLEEATNDAAAIAALMWLFLAPGSRTSLRQLKKADNLSLMVGAAGDVTAGPDLGAKMRDVQFVTTAIERTAQRLGKSFLMVSAVQRNAERVTAEEWTKMTQEIDQAMGGLYSELGQGFQSLVIRRFVVLHNEDDKGLAKLPDKYFRVAPISATDAMGREAENETLVQTTGTALQLFKEEAGKRINIDAWMQRLFLNAGVRLENLIKSADQVAQETQQATKQAMMQQVVAAGAGPAAAAVAKSAPGMMAQAAQQPPPDGSEPPGPQDAAAVSQPQ